MLLGYARVSKEDQKLELQLQALSAAGCERIFSDKKSGAQKARKGLEDALSHLRPGDTLVVWKLDRLGRTSLPAHGTEDTPPHIKARVTPLPHNSVGRTYRFTRLAVAGASPGLEHGPADKPRRPLRRGAVRVTDRSISLLESGSEYI